MVIIMEGIFVKNTNGFITPWNREIIIQQIMKETRLSELFFNKPSATYEEADRISRAVEGLVYKLNIKCLSGPLIREMVNTVLLEQGHNEWRNVMTRVGASVYDAYEIDSGYGFEANDNANQLNNAETSHKRKADKMSKEQNLLLLPERLANLHLDGACHVHDLEYFGTRPFCFSGDTKLKIKNNNNSHVFSMFISEVYSTIDAMCLDSSDLRNFCVLTPLGWKPILKITSRTLEKNEYLLKIRTASSRELKVTPEHRIPVFVYPTYKFSITIASDLHEGDRLRLNILNTYTVDRIISITKVPYEGEVYDLFIDGDETEESHMFYLDNGLLVHNCQDWDARYFFYYGLLPDGVGVQSSIAKPAKNAEVAILQLVKALGSAQTNFAGGQGMYNFLTFLAPYFEGKSEKEIKQLMQMFVYEMMQMFCARGGQVIFSSVQLTPGVNRLWKDKPVVAKGKVFDGVQAPLRTYGEFEREVRLSFSTLMDVMLEGDAIGKPFSFPKPEISIEADFMQEDEEFNRNNPDLLTYKELYLKAFKLAAKFGTPYFDNQLPEYRSSKGGISCYQCCAYQFSANPADDLAFEDKMYFRGGAHFSMGSWMVMSLNCPRVAYKANHDDAALFAGLKSLMNDAVEIFRVKRTWMDDLIKKNRIPFASQRPTDPNTKEIGSMAVDFDALVYTIGVIGINEMVQYHTGSQMHESQAAFKLAVRAMFEMKLYAQELSKKHGITIALARTPAETTAQRFAVSDLLHLEYREKAETVVKGDVNAALTQIKSTKDLPIYYTNGTHLAVNANVTLPEKIKCEHTFFPVVDGGNILHLWLGEGSSSPEGLMDFAMNLCKNTQVGYFAFTKDMTVCINEGYVASGLLDKCPKCGSTDVQHLSRITGYLQAVEGWNAGKRQELRDRKRVNIQGVM